MFTGASALMEFDTVREMSHRRPVREKHFDTRKSRQELQFVCSKVDGIPQVLENPATTFREDFFGPHGAIGLIFTHLERVGRSDSRRRFVFPRKAGSRIPEKASGGEK